MIICFDSFYFLYNFFLKKSVQSPALVEVEQLSTNLYYWLSSFKLRQLLIISQLDKHYLYIGIMLYSCVLAYIQWIIKIKADHFSHKMH